MYAVILSKKVWLFAIMATEKNFLMRSFLVMLKKRECQNSKYEKSGERWEFLSKAVVNIQFSAKALSLAKSM